MPTLDPNIQAALNDKQDQIEAGTSGRILTSSGVLGKVKELPSSVGSPSQPIYINNGVPVPANTMSGSGYGDTLNTILEGYVVGGDQPVDDNDTLLEAIGKIQGQIDALENGSGGGNPSGTAGGELTGSYPNPNLLNSAVINKTLTGLTQSTAELTQYDSILSAFGKLMGRVNSKVDNTNISAGTLGRIRVSSGVAGILNEIETDVGSTSLPIWIDKGVPKVINHEELVQAIFGNTGVGGPTQPIYIDDDGNPVPCEFYPATGEPTGVAGGQLSGTYPNPSLVNSAVISKVLTGLTSQTAEILPTDTIVQALGKAKGRINTKYTKPSPGIPKSDLAFDVQDSLSKMDQMFIDIFNSTRTFVGLCQTVATTVAKAVAVSTDGSHVPTAGNIYVIKFTLGNSANNITINLDGTGNKTVYLGGQQPKGTSGTGGGFCNANGFIAYYFDGTFLHQIGSTNVLSSTVGSNTKPIYLNSGTFTASTANVGSGTKHIYINSGNFTESSSSVGSSTQPIYLSGGILTASGSNIGSESQGIYLKNGVLTPMPATAGAPESHECWIFVQPSSSGTRSGDWVPSQYGKYTIFCIGKGGNGGACGVDTYSWANWGACGGDGGMAVARFILPKYSAATGDIFKKGNIGFYYSVTAGVAKVTFMDVDFGSLTANGGGNAGGTSAGAPGNGGGGGTASSGKVSDNIYSTDKYLIDNGWVYRYAPDSETDYSYRWQSWRGAGGSAGWCNYTGDSETTENRYGTDGAGDGWGLSVPGYANDTYQGKDNSMDWAGAGMGRGGGGGVSTGYGGSDSPSTRDAGQIGGPACVVVIREPI